MMSFDELADELKKMYEAASEGERMVAIHVFGIKYARELADVTIDDLAEQGTGHANLGAILRHGLKLAQYVDVKREMQTAGKNTEERYRVIEVSNGASLEEHLNKEAGWRLHSFSVCPCPARPGMSMQEVVIIAALEREQTARCLT